MATALSTDEHLKILAENLRKLRWAHYETTKLLSYELDRNAVAQMALTLDQLIQIVEIIVNSRL